MSETAPQQCSYVRKGPDVGSGRRIVAWRAFCQRKVRVPVGTPAYQVRCWQHPRRKR